MDFSPSLSDATHIIVIPTKAGTQGFYEVWIPAFARMTIFGFDSKGLSVPIQTHALSVHGGLVRQCTAAESREQI